MSFDIKNIDFSKSQRIMIWGLPGRGKTLLLTDLCIRGMIETFYMVDDVFDEIDELNEIGYHLNKNFEHLIFSNYDVNSDGSDIPDLKCYKVNPYKLGLKGKFETQCFPMGSSFFITELQNYYPATMNDYIRPEILRFWQTSRHYDLSLYGDVQRPIDIAKKIRDLFDIFIECVSVEEIIKENRIVGHKWKLLIIENSRQLEEYLKSNNVKLCKEVIYISDECRYYNYNSKFCRLLHLKGRENEQFYIEHFGFNDDDLFTEPNGYFIKNVSRAINVNEDYEVVF